MRAPLGIDAELPEMPGVVVQHVLLERAGEFVELRDNVLMQRPVFHHRSGPARCRALVGVERDIEIKVIEHRPDFRRKMFADIFRVLATREQDRKGPIR